ncbi:hypothetical protein [Gillisia sp. CAL575]|uniref:hypothetical protein n=1 Tax=Gillisia sp. CAL575 TaxID=985255 RepID=UPI00039984CA|nr:hypothetical protein [Gillisia sp. CAL575]
MIGINEDEIIDFIKLLAIQPIHIQFKEFMTFDGNQYDMSRVVAYNEVLNYFDATLEETNVQRIIDRHSHNSTIYQEMAIKTLSHHK